jgi:hypothetical protein
MSVVLTATAGLCLWIVLWALNVSGFDGILIVIGLVVVMVALQNVVPFLTGRRNR